MSRGNVWFYPEVNCKSLHTHNDLCPHTQRSVQNIWNKGGLAEVYVWGWGVFCGAEAKFIVISFIGHMLIKAMISQVNQKFTVDHSVMFWLLVPNNKQI